MRGTRKSVLRRESAGHQEDPSTGLSSHLTTWPATTTEDGESHGQIRHEDGEIPRRWEGRGVGKIPAPGLPNRVFTGVEAHIGARHACTFVAHVADPQKSSVGGATTEACVTAGLSVVSALLSDHHAVKLELRIGKRARKKALKTRTLTLKAP